MLHQQPERLLITGASGSIGRALACHYAAPGVSLHLLGRNLTELALTAATCKALGANVQYDSLDLLDVDATRKWVNNLSADQTPDLLIINAGLNHHISDTEFDGSQNEDAELSHQVLMVNLMSAIKLVQGVIPFMQARGSGQIALISSLAAWRGFPHTPSYCASKAGLKAYGESLRMALEPSNIKVNVVLPGYVESAMCNAMPGPKPWVLKPEQAAQRIASGLARNHGRITFPFWLSFGTQLLSIMPDAWAIRVLKWLGYGVKRRETGR
jgi:short-subunit dehydrogenase